MDVEQSPGPRRRRSGPTGKRLRFAVPKVALPVRGLWEAASSEEKAMAHRQCVAILEWWVGRRSREAVGQELGLSGLRVWQLSQSALSGMLAGLLRQPRRRGRAAMRAVLGDPSLDVNSLRKQLAETQRKLAIAERLIRLLRELPEAKARSLLESQAEDRPEANRRAGGKKVGTRRVDPPRGDDAAAGGEPPSR
jgi:hypothetical protein